VNPRPSQEKEPTIRTFICIDIPGNIKLQMEALQTKLRAAGGQVSWVKPANVHLTLKFLGNVAEHRIVQVCSAVRRAARVTGPFAIEVGGAGGFPSSRAPRVLWVGLAKSPPELLALYKSVEDELYSLGFDRETRGFSPHLTIGRLRSQQNARQLGDLITAMGFEPETFEAPEVIVMRSNLKPTGAIYTPIDVVPLDRSEKPLS
jgi:RNA 2',3'-cyclic 3'-phosphodiesterase